MSDYPMLISNKLHSFRNFALQSYNNMFKNIYIFSIFQRKFVTLQYSLQPIPFLPARFFICRFSP